MSELLDKAMAFAYHNHRGQLRRNGETAYIEHPKAVAAKLAAQGEPEEVQAVAWLHDVMEDSDVMTGDLLKEGFSPTVVDAVVAITHYPSETYSHYLERVKENPTARRVKVADILHNLSDSPTRNQIIKYSNALLKLV